jgi:hypothetical protein
MSRYLVAVIAPFLAFPAMAESPSFNFIELGYEFVDLDLGGGADVDGDGYAVGGSFEIGDNMFGFVSYADFFARAAYVDAEIDAPGFESIDENGYGVGIGVRSNVSDLIELYGEVAYVDLGSGADSTAFGVGIYFNISDSFALGLGASVDDDVTSYGASARFYFGN